VNRRIGGNSTIRVKKANKTLSSIRRGEIGKGPSGAGEATSRTGGKLRGWFFEG